MCGQGELIDECPGISKALHQHDVGVLFLEPGLDGNELALLGCYFGWHPPPHSPWPPLLPDDMILHCSSRLQKCEDTEGCPHALDGALETTHPSELGLDMPELMTLIGCTFCASSIDWATYPQYALSMEMDVGGRDSLPNQYKKVK